MRTKAPLLVIALAASAACARIGNLGPGLGTTLARDARQMAVRGGPAYPGPHAVDAAGLRLAGAGFPVVLYRPRDTAPGQRAPAVIFLPGRFAPEDQYESYGRLLASHGFVVVVRGLYGPEYTDESLVRDTLWLTRWLTEQPYVDAARIGVAGHSMGGRDAITAAVQDPRLRAVVSIDPGGRASYPVIYGDMRRLRARLLLIGAEVAWRGEEVCAPRSTNYERFFAQSRPGTLELTLRGADHMQVMDEPDRLGQHMCRVGTADSTRVRILSRAATVQFFQETLQGAPRRAYVADGALASVRERPAPTRRAIAQRAPSTATTATATTSATTASAAVAAASEPAAIETTRAASAAEAATTAAAAALPAAIIAPPAARTNQVFKPNGARE